MKRTGSGIGFAATKKPHSEKMMGNTSVADTKYAKSDVDNEPELARSVDALASYVKNNRMKY